MRRLKFIIKKELKQFFRDRMMLRVIIVIPLGMMFLFGYAVTTDVKNIPIAICDLDNSKSSRQLIQKLENSGYFDLNVFEPDIEHIGGYLDRGDVRAAVIIPNRFADDLSRNRQPQVQLLIDGQDANSSQIALGYIANIIRSYSEDIFVDVLNEQPQLAAAIHTLTPEIRIWFNPNLESVNFMIPGIVAMIVTVFSMFFTAMAVVREKEDGTLEQLMVTPISSLELMIGKTLPFVIIAFLDAAVIMILAKLWFGIPIEGNMLVLMLFIFLYLLTTLGLGLFVSTVSQTQMQALFLGWFFMVMMLLLSGFFIPVENMPHTIQLITYLNPLRYLITVVREIFLKGSGFIHLWHEAAALSVFGIIIITLSTLRFQKRVK
ncbi:ABC transporter permease [candidate division KSB1 bacterium]|nr:ABC transporter permease [candidate division KSB1 bacterium]